MSDSGEVTGAVMHHRPLIIASPTRDDEVIFKPRSPNAYEKELKCGKISHRDDINFYQCEDFSGSSFYLRSGYPIVDFSNQKDSYITFVDPKTGQKSCKRISATDDVGTEAISGVVEPEFGNLAFSGIMTQNGFISMHELRQELYDHVWPTARVYFRDLTKHYFTFIRDCEEKFKESPKGRRWDIWVTWKPSFWSKARGWFSHNNTM